MVKYSDDVLPSDIFLEVTGPQIAAGLDSQDEPSHKLKIRQDVTSMILDNEVEAELLDLQAGKSHLLVGQLGRGAFGVGKCPFLELPLPAARVFLTRPQALRQILSIGDSL